MIAYRRGMGASSPTIAPGMIDCGGGLSVRAGTACPPPVGPPTAAQQAALLQAQADYNARAARCKTYQTQEYGLDLAAGAIAALLLPGAWKLLAIPIAIAVEVWYPRSPDCDYGF